MSDRRDVPVETESGGTPLDPVLAPFARAQAAIALSADGRTVVWATPGAIALFGGAVPVPAPAGLARAVAKIVRSISGSSVATLADLPVPGIEAPMACACRLLKREEGGDLLMVMPLDALPGVTDVHAPPAAEAPVPSKPEPLPLPEPIPASASEPIAEADERPPQPAPETAAAEARTVPVAETAPPADEPASPLEDLRQRAAGRAIVRFIWQSDGEGSIRRVSPDLAAILGPSAAAIEGKSLPEILRPMAAEADLVDRLQRHETVTGARILWPVDGLAVPVDLSAMPSFEAGNGFRGFRGFGLIRVGEARPREVERPHDTPSPAEPVPVVPAPGTSILPAAAIETSPTDASPVPSDTGPRPVAGETGLSAADQAQSALVVPEEQALPLAPLMMAPPIATPAPEEQSSEEPETPQASAETPVTEAPGTPPVAAPAPDIAAVHPPEAPRPPAPVLPFRATDAQPPAPAAPAANVVPLRAVPPPAPPHRPANSPLLSVNERRAFRDIARALGARVEDDELPGERPAAETPAAVASPAAPPSAEPPAKRSAPDPAAEASELIARHSADILERLPVGVLVSRADRILYANRTLLDLLDYPSVASIEGHTGLRGIFRTRSPETTAEFAAVSPVLLVARDGETVTVDARIQSLDWDGRKATLMTVRRSLEAEHAQRLRSAELELRTREADLRETRSILDTATDGVIVIDERGRVHAMNRAAEALFGYDQKEIAGEPFTVLMAPESHAVAVDYLEGLKSGGVRSVLNDGREVIGRVRQGGPQPLFMTIGQVSDTPERKFCAVLRDLTPWKKAEGELVEARKAAERANQQKSEFLAKISHEIRTPLNAIIGFAEVMMEERFGPVGNERYKDYLRDVHGSGQHVISLVNDLLDLSKIEAGKMELTFAAVDVNAVVNGSVALIQPQAQQGRVVVRTSLSRKVPPVVADQRSLKQVVLNLLSNAVKFTDPGGQVIVSTGVGDSGDVLIRVRDTGIGMSDKEIGEALEPFRQLHTARRAGGTGLGLPLTKALVEANRATLRISSVRREGTLVEIVFPPTRVLAE